MEVPRTAFHLVATAVRGVPTVDAMNALPPTWDLEATPTLGPYVETEAETEVARPARHIQLIPGRYASLLVDWRCIHAKQAYRVRVGTLRAQDELEACRDVVT